MKAIRTSEYFICALLVVGTAFFPATADASASDSHQNYPQSGVVAHVPMPGGATRQMFLRREGRKHFLYVQRPSQRGFTIIDVTRPELPIVVSRVPLESRTVIGSGLVVTVAPDKPATMAAYGGSESAEGIGGGNTDHDSIHVLNVSDPAPPRTDHTFAGIVSAVTDDARGLVYILDGDGVWILSHQQVSQCTSSDAMSAAPNCN
jgi:hypothetical protein